MTECHCAEAPMPSPETLRMLELRAWLKSLGCCSMCSLRLAIVILEKEHGRGACDMPVSCGRRGERTSCDDMARAAYQTKPKVRA